MRVKQMQAMVAATLLFGGVLLGTHTTYAALGKVVDIAEVKESESDRTSYRGRVEKPIDEVYAPLQTEGECGGFDECGKYRDRGDGNRRGKRREAHRHFAPQL